MREVRMRFHSAASGLSVYETCLTLSRHTHEPPEVQFQCCATFIKQNMNTVKFKAALIYMYIWKWIMCNVKKVACGDESTELSASSAVPLISADLHHFVLVFKSTPLLLCSSLITFTDTISSHSSQLFSEKKPLINPLYATCPGLNGSNESEVYGS